MQDSRANSFNALRLVGALLVIVGHSVVLYGRPQIAILGLSLHSLGVKIFFAISGYLIAQSYMRDPDLVRFASRRALRLMPALLVVVPLTILVCAFFSTESPSSYFSSRETWTYLLRNIFLLTYYPLPGVFTENTFAIVNGSLWTLPIETLMYVATPLLLRTPRRSLWLLLVLGMVLVLTDPRMRIFGIRTYGPFYLIPYFLAGAVFAQIQPKKWFVPVSLIVLGASAFIPGVNKGHIWVLGNMLYSWEWLMVVPITVLVLALGRSRWLPNLHTDVSYGLYLIAYPIQQIFIQTLHPEPWALVLLTLAAGLPIAWLSWQFIEKPALRLKPSKRSAAPTTPATEAGSPDPAAEPRA